MDPDGVRQAAGHPGVVHAYGDGGCIVKRCPLQEAQFYEQVMNGTDAAHRHMQACMPRCLGIRIEGESARGWPPFEAVAPNAVLLENLTHKFVRADVCDIKLGTLLYDERPGYTDDAKVGRMQHKARTTTSGAYGMRVAGWTAWNENEFHAVGKEPGKAARTLDDMAQLMTQALRTDMPVRRRAIVRKLLPQVRELKTHVAQVPAQLRSASVLVVAEGDTAALEAAQDTPAPVCDVRLIDFAHSRWSPAEGVDLGIQRGLATLVQILELWA